MLYKKSTADWRQIGDKRIYARSLWEANFARYLQWQKEREEIVDWEHEPKTFWFTKILRGVNSYKPDFLITTKEGHYWVEVKGYYDTKSMTKIRRMRKFFPEEKLVLIDANWFEKNNNIMRGIIPLWEKGT